jgi:hypothetical protein
LFLHCTDARYADKSAKAWPFLSSEDSDRDFGVINMARGIATILREHSAEWNHLAVVPDAA